MVAFDYASTDADGPVKIESLSQVIAKKEKDAQIVERRIKIARVSL